MQAKPLLRLQKCIYKFAGIVPILDLVLECTGVLRNNEETAPELSQLSSAVSDVITILELLEECEALDDLVTDVVRR